MTSQDSRTRSQFTSPALGLILLLAAGLRVFRIGNQSLWADEGNSVVLAGRSLGEIAGAAAADIHPPLYYWLLHFWVRIFGTSETAVRMLSALWGVFLVWLVYQIGSRLFDRRTGLVAAFLAAINPFLIYYSQEARMYAQLAALAALLFYALVRFILHESVVMPADGSGKTMAFSGLATGLILVSAIAGLYTHYTFLVLLMAATVLYLLWVYDSRRRGFVRFRVLHWGMLLIIMAFAYLPWIPTAFRQLTSWPSTGEAVSLNQALSELLRLLSLGPVAQFEATSLWLTLFLGLFALGLWPWATRPGGRRAHWLSWLLPLLWLAAPVALILVADLYKPAYLKFLLVAVAPFCLLMARGATGLAEMLERRISGRERTPAAQSRSAGPAQAGVVARPGVAGSMVAPLVLSVALALVAVPTTMTLRAYYFDPTAARDDYRGMAAYIEAIASPEDAVILNAPGQRDVFEIYCQGDLPVYGLPEQRPPDETATVGRIAQIASQHPRLYLLLWATDESDRQNLIEGWLDTHAFQAADTWHGNVRLVIYATQQPTDDWPSQDSGVALVAGAEANPVLRLQSYALSTQNVTAGDVLQLQLVWEALQQPGADYTVFLQLLDQRNQVVAQRDAPPAGGAQPTSTWRTGEEFVDNHGMLVWPATAPGEYRLIAGLYDSQTGERLLAGAADYIDLGTLRVERESPPPSPEALNMQHEDVFMFEEITLLGHDRYKRGFRHAPETPLNANDLLHLTFYWRADLKPTTAWWFTARLVEGSDKEVASVSGPLVSELYPTLNWQAGEVVRGEHDLPLPDYLQPGRYQLQLFLHTGSRPESVADRVNLGTVVITE